MAGRVPATRALAGVPRPWRPHRLGVDGRDTQGHDGLGKTLLPRPHCAAGTSKVAAVDVIPTDSTSDPSGGAGLSRILSTCHASLSVMAGRVPATRALVGVPRPQRPHRLGMDGRDTQGHDGLGKTLLPRPHCTAGTSKVTAVVEVDGPTASSAKVGLSNH